MPAIMTSLANPTATPSPPGSVGPSIPPVSANVTWINFATGQASWPGPNIDRTGGIHGVRPGGYSPRPFIDERPPNGIGSFNIPSTRSKCPGDCLFQRTLDGRIGSLHSPKEAAGFSWNQAWTFCSEHPAVPASMDECVEFVKSQGFIESQAKVHCDYGVFGGEQIQPSVPLNWRDIQCTYPVVHGEDVWAQRPEAILIPSDNLTSRILKPRSATNIDDNDHEIDAENTTTPPNSTIAVSDIPDSAYLDTWKWPWAKHTTCDVYNKGPDVTPTTTTDPTCPGRCIYATISGPHSKIQRACPNPGFTAKQTIDFCRAHYPVEMTTAECREYLRSQGFTTLQAWGVCAQTEREGGVKGYTLNMPHDWRGMGCQHRYHGEF